MPGLDLTQLVEGITYPNSTYQGNAFPPADEYTLDTILQDQAFSPVEVDARTQSSKLLCGRRSLRLRCLRTVARERMLLEFAQE
jgi:hypothetical protein